MKKKKILINGTISLALAVASVIAIVNNKSASANEIQRLETQIKNLQAQSDEARKEAARLQQEAKTLQNAIEEGNRQRASIEAQIKITEAQYRKLELEIKQTEEDIENNRKAIGTILVEMSLEDDVSPIERLASSENISKALDNFEYQSSVKDSLVKKVEEIKAQKKSLETKRDQLKVTLADQNKLKTDLQAKISEQNTLMEKTKGEEAEYQKYASARDAERAKLEKQQADLILQQSRANASSGGVRDLGAAGSAYPWGGGWGCSVNQATYVSNRVDPLGYGCGQCVSYTAWRIYKETGKQALWWGNANMWPASARRNGYATGTTPRAGSIAVMYVGVYGHVAWVESVSGGTMVISQYNWPTASNGWRWGEYSKMEISTSKFHEYIYIK